MSSICWGGGSPHSFMAPYITSSNSLIFSLIDLEFLSNYVVWMPFYSLWHLLCKKTQTKYKTVVLHVRITAFMINSFQLNSMMPVA